MPDDFDSKVDAIASKSASGGDDFDSKVDAIGAAPKKSFDYTGAAKSFASNILPGLAEIPEQVINANQYIGRNMPGFLAPLLGPTPGSADSGDVISNLNLSMDRPAIPYLDATNAMRNNPAMGFGQTPNQLTQQHPVAGTIGNLAGSLPAGIAAGPGMLGEIPALAKLGLTGKIAASALAGGEYAGTTGALQSASDQAKINDTIDWGKVAKDDISNVGWGMGLGAVGGLIGGLVSNAFAKKTPYIPPAEPKQIGYNYPRIEMKERIFTPPAPPKPPEPKRIEMKKSPFAPEPLVPTGGPRLIEKKLIPPGPTERARMNSELYNPGFRHAEVVHAEILPPEPKAEKPTRKTKIKAKEKPTIKIISTPLPPRDVIEGKVEEISFPDESWRQRREAQARPANAEETPLVKRLARLKIEVDNAEAKLAGALKAIYKELNLSVPNKKGHIEPRYRDIVTKAAKDLGGEPENRTAYVEATLSPGDQAPQHYEFRRDGLMGHVEEIKELNEDYNKKKDIYDRFKDDREENFTQTLPLNQVVQTQITDSSGRTRSINVKRVWRPTKYKFPTKESAKQYEATRQHYENLSAPYPELTTPAFQKVITEAANRGDLPDVEYLASHGALDWFKKLDKGTQNKVLLAIGLAASVYLSNQQEAEAAPPQLFSKVITQLAKNGWKEWMGSRPITRITQLEVTSDMIRKGFDTTSKQFGQARFGYLERLKIANVGARKMTEAEKDGVKGLEPWQLRRTPLLQGWTQMEKNKAGDIAALNQAYKQLLKDEQERVENLGVEPGHLGAANRYKRGLDIDAEDMGLHLGYSPMGSSVEMFDKLTGEVMTSQFLGNTRVAALHVGEAIVASASKYPLAFAQALHGLTTNPLYRDFVGNNSPKGMFQQVLESQKGFKYRQAINKAINEPIDNAIKRLPHGDLIYQTLSAQLPERGKLGFNSLVIALHESEKYPGGPEQYMRDWLANAKNRIPVPPARQLEFAKTGLRAMIEENIAVMNLPEGPLKERTSIQRVKALSFIFPYTRGAFQQSRFFASLADDLLAAIASGDTQGALHASKALIIASLLTGAVAGSHAVPGYIWGALEQIDNAAYGTAGDIEALKDLIDSIQGSVSGGNQMQEFGLKGFAVSKFPTPALQSLWQRILRDARPKNKMDMMRAVFDFSTAAFISRIGPVGTLNLNYMLERLKRGLEGHEQFRQYESSPAGVAMDALQGRPYASKLVDKKLPFDLGQGVSHALLNVQNAGEQKAIKQAEKKSAKNWQKDTKKLGKTWQKALAK